MSQLEDIPGASPADTTGSARSSSPGPARWAAALAGAVAAGMGLFVAVLPSAVTGSEPTLVTGVGGWFIDTVGASLKDVAIWLFGTNDKAALIVGMVIVCVGLGALVGRAAADRPWVAWAGYGGAAAFGLFVTLDRPNATTAHLVVGAVLGTVAAVVTLHVLLRFAPAEAVPGSPVLEGATRPPMVGSRRQFLALSGGAGLVAAAGGLALVRGSGGSTVPAAGSASAVALPTPVDRTPVPAELLGPPPVAGQTPYLMPNDRFYRIDTALVPPRVDARRWQVQIKGLVDRPFGLTFDQLLALPMVERPVTLSCVSNEVGGDLVGNATWLGVPLSVLLERAGVRPEAQQVVGESVDGFTAGFPVAAVLDGRDALVAVAMNGEPLPVRHGYPARLVVAGLYGYVSATKWLKEIRLTRWDDEEGYWIPRGWAREAPIKTQSRIDVPGAKDVQAGRVAVAGVAWAPTRGISAVEVEVDGGWRPARLLPTASDATWVQWVYEWDAAPGTYLLRVRATDGAGDVQTEERSRPDPDGATGYHNRSVTVVG